MKRREIQKQVRQMNNQQGVSALELVEKKKKYSLREEKLKNMTWGMGLEHETQFFYIPNAINSKYSLDEIVVMATELPVTELLERSNTLSESHRNLLEKIDFEETGRRCNGKIILDKLMFEYGGKKEPLKMPEFITEKPFSNLKNPRSILNYCSELIEKEVEYENILRRMNYLKKFFDKYDLLMGQYPFGMCSNIRIRKDYTNDSPSLEKKHYQDYTGSFHYTITLPFEEKEKYSEEDEKKFVDRHYNFGAMFQWIEPLLLAAYFSCDQKAVGTSQKRIRGSFRVARVGWGNFAGSDMRMKNTGTGRYATVEPYWRDNFKFYESNKTKECRFPHWQEDQAISSFSSNIRTFGPDPSKPDDPKARISGAKMTIPNGMEIRIFDHFPTINLLSLLQIIILVAANADRVKVKDYVYDDEDWKKTIQKIMIEGWRAEIGPVFIKKLENVFDIEIQPKTIMAYDVLVSVVNSLFEKNRDSDIVFLMYGPLMKPTIPMINKYSWEMAFMLKIIGDNKIYEKYKKFVSCIIDYDNVKDFGKCVEKCFGKTWKKNWIDILYFFEGKYLIEVDNERKKYKVNSKFMKDFIDLNFIKYEVLIQLNFNAIKLNDPLKKKIYDKAKSNFFSYQQIIKRYKNYSDASNPSIKFQLSRG